MAQNLGYAVPRAAIVLGGWGLTYWILTVLSTDLPPTAIYITGVAWVAAGAACFGYLYRLRRAFGIPGQVPVGAEQDRS